MTSVLNYPNQTKVTTNITLRVIELPLGVRTPSTYTITAGNTGTASTVTVTAQADIGATTLAVSALAAAIPANTILTLGSSAVVTSAAALISATSLTIYPLNFTILANTGLTLNPGSLAIGSTMLPVTALPALIDVGTTLTFGGQTLTVTGRSPAGATQLRVSPLVSAVTSGATATTRALWAVVGCTSSPVPSPEPKVVDTTNLLSGIGMEKVITAINQTMTVNFNVINGDLGGGLIVQILRDKNKYNREMYFEVLMPDGELHSGVAIVTAGPESGEVQDLRKIQCTLQVQGATYTYTPSPFTFF